MTWEQKYLKYKKKYLELSGGAPNRCRKKVNEEITFDEIEILIKDLYLKEEDYNEGMDETNDTFKTIFFNSKYGNQLMKYYKKITHENKRKFKDKIEEIISELSNDDDKQKMRNINIDNDFSSDIDKSKKLSVEGSKILISEVKKIVVPEYVELNIDSKLNILINNYIKIKKNYDTNNTKLITIEDLLFKKIYQSYYEKIIYNQEHEILNSLKIILNKYISKEKISDLFFNNDDY
jgi:hypothetical protein